MGAFLSDNLKEQILATRKMSADNRLVTYDLTTSVDFSHPRKTAEALAQVFFETDAIKWFTISDGDVDFKPSYKALILVDEDDNSKVDKTMKDFIKDVETDEINYKYLKKVEASGHNHTGLLSAFPPYMLSLIFQTQNFNDDDLIIEILDDIKKNTEIREVTIKK